VSEYDYEAEYRENEADAALQRRRTRLAQLARRDVSAALLALTNVMETYDAADTGRLVLPEEGQYDAVIDDMGRREVDSLIHAHATLVTLRAHLSHFLKDR
jgi:hypothetical protein